MTCSGLLSASSRRIILTVGVAALSCVGSVLRAQQAAPAQAAAAPAAQTAAPEDPLKLNSDVPVILVFQVKPDRIADFEAAWAGIRAGLTRSANAELKAFGATLQPYKVQGFEGVYVFHLLEPSKTISYNPVHLLYFADKDLFKREDADALFAKWNGAAAGFNKWPLVKVGG